MNYQAPNYASFSKLPLLPPPYSPVFKRPPFITRSSRNAKD